MHEHTPLHLIPPSLPFRQHFVALAVQASKGGKVEGALLVAHCKCSLEFVANKVKWQRAATIFHTHTHEAQKKQAKRGEEERKVGLKKVREKPARQQQQ